MSGDLQVMPDLSPDEYAALRDSIAEHGVLVPVELDEAGAVLDGHQRLRACAELGMRSYPSVIIPGLTGTEKRTMARRLNCERRQLTQVQRRALVAGQLRDTPDWANNRIAAVVGVNHETVQAVRQALESACEIRKFTALVGGDGKVRRARRPAIVTKNGRERETAIGILPRLDVKRTASRLMDLGGLWSEIRKQERGDRGVGEADAQVGRAALLLGDFRQRGAEVPDGTVAVVLTDPPCTRDAMPLWADLGALAARVLHPGGLLAAYCGALYIPEALARLSESLEYCWVGSVTYGGFPRQFYPRKVVQMQRLVLYFTRQGDTPGRWFHDLHQGAGREKSEHRWQQGLPEAEALVLDLTDAGDRVLDPFMGSGTFPLAAVLAGREAIGIEVDPATFATAEKRIRDAAARETQA